MALSLRAHGQSAGALAQATIDDYVDDVREVVASLAAPPILVGHSMGGFVVQKYLMRNPAAAAVLLCSAAPRTHMRVMLRHLAHHPRLFWNLARTDRPTVVFDPQLIGLAFVPGLTPIELATIAPLLQAESSRALRQVGTDALAVQPQVPTLVIGAMNDPLIPMQDVLETARVYKTNATFVQSGHDVMLDTHWQSTAEIILAWLQAIAQSAPQPKYARYTAQSKHSVSTPLL